MKPLLSTTAMGLLLCLGYSLPASAEQSKDCGVTMPCAKMGTDLKYTSGVQSKDCGVTMPCAKAAAAGTATAAAKRTRVSNGPSVVISDQCRGDASPKPCSGYDGSNWLRLPVPTLGLGLPGHWPPDDHWTLCLGANGASTCLPDVGRVVPAATMGLG